jgi:tetratricopeptide (TPR) repeat protein
MKRAHYFEAEHSYRHAETAASKIWGPKHPFRAEVLIRLAILYLEQGRYEDSELICQEVHEMVEKVLEAAHPILACVWDTRGRLAIAQGRHRQARPFLRDALRIRQDTCRSQDHPEIARIMGALASLDNSPMRYPSGVEQYEHAIKMARATLDDQHPEIARLQLGLARLHINRGKYAKAEPLLQQALTIQEATLVPYHPDLAATLETYAELLRSKTPSDGTRAAELQAQAEKIRSDHAKEDREIPRDSG